MSEVSKTSGENIDHKPTFAITLMYCGLLFAILWPIGLIWGLIQHEKYGLGRIIAHAGISLGIVIIISLLMFGSLG